MITYLPQLHTPLRHHNPATLPFFTTRTTFQDCTPLLPLRTTLYRYHELPCKPRGASCRSRLIRCAWWRRRRRLASLPVAAVPRRKRRVVDRRAASLTPSPLLSPPQPPPAVGNVATRRCHHRRCHCCHDSVQRHRYCWNRDKQKRDERGGIWLSNQNQWDPF